MIKYSLRCDKGHEFESWFAGSAAYEEQVDRGLVECPFCGSQNVSKALMAPSVSTARKKEARMEAIGRQMAARAIAAQGAAPAAAAPVSVPAPVAAAPAVAAPVALLDENHRKLREAIRELHGKIAENTVDVGTAFPEEARKIHEGDAPERPIRGQATFEQARELWEDGIPVLPVPALPDDSN
ncbi:MAG: DUF1178 family protein [Beijerinckiaceae bacterium]